MPQPTQPRVAVSYSWEEEREGANSGAVEGFCASLRTAGVEVVHDVKRLRHGKSISEFMRSIGASDFLCVFLSEAYLKSPNCMYELLVAWQRSKDNLSEFRQRVKVWVMPGTARIDRLESRLKYVNYWREEGTRINRLIVENIGAVSGATIEEHRRIESFAREVEPMLQFFADTLSPATADDFESWIREQFPDEPAEVDEEALATVYDNLVEEIEDIAPEPFMIESDRQRYRFEAIERPTWAKKIWHDRFGLAAEFRIQDVSFILRWIPPGSFLMGSPEDEPGRFDDEGPRHLVTITRGFWMADTPVTQAQWRAVVEAAREERPSGKENDLSPAPSHFQGPPDLPVESVTWHQITAFCRMLDALLPEGPGFHLPTEAQWEYACRAGTETALYTGEIEILGRRNAPALDEIAWYGGNSGVELEVENPEDSKEWLEKQYPHEKAGTHRVKLKKANPFGLYDSLGNVFEWCRDAWGDEPYVKRIEGATDPETSASDESADRVMRGGSWFGQAQYCRAAIRSRDHPGPDWSLQGLRLAAGQERGAAEPQGAERLPERRSRARRAGGKGPA